MRKIISFLTANLKYILLLYVLIQLVYVFIYPISFTSDSLYYYQLAASSLSHGTIYPSTINLQEDYIIAPLFINLQILVLYILNSSTSIGLLHIILNLIQLFFLFQIAGKYLNKESAAIFVLLYMFYLPNIGFVLLNMTELLFGVLLSLSVYFMMKESNRDYFFAGILASASVAVRPTGWALLAAFFVFLLLFHSGKKFKQILFLTAGTVLFFTVMGTLTYLSSGHAVISSVNYGTNLLIGANDDASGAYNDKVFQEGKAGFINNPETKTYIEKQQLWYAQALNWIKENPIAWLKIFPLKLVHIFIWDDYAISPLLHMQDWNLYKILKHLLIERNLEDLMSDVPLHTKIVYIALQIIHHLYYFMIVIMFFFFTLKNFKSLTRDNLFRLVLIVIGFAVLIPLLSFGDARFKYPYILLMMIMISPFLKNYFYKT